MSSDRDVAFPTLTSAELQALSTRGTRRQVRTGEILYQEGDRDHSFFVVLEGAVEVLDNSRGAPHQLTVHHRGQFSGDVDLMSSRVTLVTGRVIEDGAVLQLSIPELRRAVDEMPDLGDKILKAFLMRRTLILADGSGRQNHRLAVLSRGPPAPRLRQPKRDSHPLHGCGDRS